MVQNGWERIQTQDNYSIHTFTAYFRLWSGLRQLQSSCFSQSQTLSQLILARSGLFQDILLPSAYFACFKFSQRLLHFCLRLLQVIPFASVYFNLLSTSARVMVTNTGALRPIRDVSISFPSIRTSPLSVISYWNQSPVLNAVSSASSTDLNLSLS